MGAISPSMFVLAWMAVISCAMASSVHGLRPWEAFTVYASVLASLGAILLEAGAIDSGEDKGKPSEDRKLRTTMNMAALVCFIARIMASVVTDLKP